MELHKEFPCGCYFEYQRGEIMAQPCSRAHEQFIRAQMPPTSIEVA